MSKHVSRLGRELGETRERLTRVESDDSEEESDGGTGTSKRKEDKPTEEIVERMEEKLEVAQADQKNLFLIIFQVSARFILMAHSFFVQKTFTRVTFGQN